MRFQESWRQINGKYRCPYCEYEATKKGIGFHIWRKHGEGQSWVSFGNRGTRYAKKKCEKCGREIAVNVFLRHRCSLTTVTVVQEEWRCDDGRYKCPYCEYIGTKSGIGPHIWRKHGLGSTFDSFLKFRETKGSWNKGLTKDVDERVAKLGVSIKNGIREGRISKPDQKIIWRKVTREKLKQTQKRRFIDGTHNWFKKMPWGVENNKYELLFDQECRKRELDLFDELQGWEVPRQEYFDDDFFLGYKLQPQNHARPDRVNRKYRIWIEIDEEKHRNTRAYDWRRDQFLRKHEWTVIRIFWKRLYNSEYMSRLVRRIQLMIKT
jgi:very-short-patch-repair endonuclease